MGESRWSLKVRGLEARQGTVRTMTALDIDSSHTGLAMMIPRRFLTRVKQGQAEG